MTSKQIFGNRVPGTCVSSVCYWNWNQDCDHCGVTTDLGNWPQPKDQASQWPESRYQFLFHHGEKLMINKQMLSRLTLQVAAWLHVHSLPLPHGVRWPYCFSIVLHVATTMISQQGLFSPISAILFIKIGNKNPVLLLGNRSGLIKNIAMRRYLKNRHCLQRLHYLNINTSMYINSISKLRLNLTMEHFE